MTDFKVGDRVRYVGGYTPFYVSPKPNALGTITDTFDQFVHSSGRMALVQWDDRLRYCKETDRREWHMKLTELEKI